MPIFAYPLALLGLVAVPALIAIYVLRNRARPLLVSSLVLWDMHRLPRHSGRRLNRLQTPLLFLLELLILTLLVMAATTPLWRSGRAARPVVIVLDDSYSMRALGAPDAPSLEAQVRRFLKTEFAKERLAARIILAGPQPRLLSQSCTSWAELAALLGAWERSATTAEIGAAITLARSVAPPHAGILVISDRLPVDMPGDGTVRWCAFGQAAGNLAVVNAVRTPDGETDRCLIEVANFTPNEHDVELTIGPDHGPTALHRLTIAPGATGVVAFTSAAVDQPLRARLPEDALAFDNEIVLAPVRTRRVKVQTLIADELLREAVERGLTASGLCSPLATPPDLVISDSHVGAEMPPAAWHLRFYADPDAQAFTGPYLTDASHPLLQGVSLDNVVWAAAGTKLSASEGRPVLLAGNLPLITDTQRFDRREIAISLLPRRSSLFRTPAWPMLLWNLLTWRAAHFPGPVAPNVRLGQTIQISAAPGTTAVTIAGPETSLSLKPGSAGQLLWPPARPGLFTATVGGQSFRIGVNPLNAVESDLRQAATGAGGDWLGEAVLQAEYRSWSWLFLLVALTGLIWHQSLIGRAGEAVRE